MQECRKEKYWQFYFCRMRCIACSAAKVTARATVVRPFHGFVLKMFKIVGVPVIKEAYDVPSDHQDEGVLGEGREGRRRVEMWKPDVADER